MKFGLNLVVISFLVFGNSVKAQNLFNPYSSQGYSYGYGFSPNTMPFDVTLSQMGLGIGIPSPYSYMYPASIYNPLEALYNPFNSNFSNYPGFMGGNQFQQYQMPSFGSQLAMNLPSLFQDYFNKASAPLEDSVGSFDYKTDRNEVQDNNDKDTCKKSGDKSWNGSECVTLGNESDCNQEIGHVWSNGTCKFKEDLSKEECEAGTDTVWAIKCVDISSDKTFCDKFSELIWLNDKCYKVNKVTSELCLKDTSKQWDDSKKSCENKPTITCKESEISYKGQCLSVLTKEYCLDPSVHNGHSGTWFHGTCWDVGCEKEEKKDDKLCIAAKHESESLQKCLDASGEWIDAKRDEQDKEKWIEGYCKTPIDSKNGENKETKESFKLFISSDTSFLKSDKKTDGQHPNKMLLGTCLETISSLGDKNIQYLKEKDQFSFRDTKRGQNGFTIANKSNSYFIEDRDLIKIRDENCKEEIGMAIQEKNLEKSKLKCSVNFKIGDDVHTVVFSKGNILANKPQFLINDTGSGKHTSDFRVDESNLKNVNYKNLYLGVENIFKESAKQIKENCTKDLRKYTSDAFVGKMLNFSGACEAVLSTGWRDQDINDKLEVELKDAIRLCKLKGSKDGNA